MALMNIKGSVCGASSFWFDRLNTSLTGPWVLRPFSHVNAELAFRPCEKRLVSLVCNPSYQPLPSGDHIVPIVPNWGYGRRLCATVCPVGEPAEGNLLNPR